MKASWIAIVMIGLLASGCSSVQKRSDDADGLARSAGFKREVIETSRFPLLSFARSTRPGGPINIYIEGDGRAFDADGSPSLDPTPREAMALQLAVRDTSPNVVYLARPCQFIGRHSHPKCSQAYWTTHRFSEDVLASFLDAVSYLSQGGAGVNLIGYSGGGAVAALLAARTDNVLSLRTVAGNLDHEYFTRLHNVPRMVGSANAADIAKTLVTLPQRHFVGGQDRIVPRSVVDSFIRSAGDARCMPLTIVPNATHSAQWDRQWPQLLTMPLGCADQL